MTENTTLRCRLFGHRSEYDIIEDSNEETLIDASCVRRGCDYTARLDQDWMDGTAEVLEDWDGEGGND